MHSGNPSITFEKLSSRDVPGLHRLLQKFENEQTRETSYFSPHSFDRKTLLGLATNPGADLYFVALVGQELCGYGMLRGWNEGYDIPSLGIFIEKAHRGQGIGGRFMQFLHSEAKKTGAQQVRLTVHASNTAAIELYRSFGYEFTRLPNDADRLVGIAQP